MVDGGSPRRRYPDLVPVFLVPGVTMTIPSSQPPAPAPRDSPDYRNFMVRELLIWLVGVPVPIAAVIGFFVL